MIVKKVKISGSVEGTIATGSYSNLKPSFLWEEEIELTFKDKEHEDKYDKYIQERRRQLYDMSFSLLKQVEVQAQVEKIEAERSDLRFMVNPKNEKVSPSVTSVINYDSDFFCSAEDLRQYASEGNCTHAKVDHYIKTGEWKAAKDLETTWVDILILNKGSLALSPDSGDFPAFLKKYKIAHTRTAPRQFSKDDLFNGEFDFLGIPHWKGAEPVATVFDIKRTPEKVKNGLQLAAYCKLAGYKQGIIVPLNSKTEQGHSRPVVYNEKQLEGYYKIFLQKRKDFKKRYGV